MLGKLKMRRSVSVTYVVRATQILNCRVELVAVVLLIEWNKEIAKLLGTGERPLDLFVGFYFEHLIPIFFLLLRATFLPISAN